jgi:MoaA/NifB/PqqE/SkfB family radical SAM enzyme
MQFVIPIENQFHYRTVPRNQDLKVNVRYRCNAPSRHLVVDWKGDCFVCSCELWLPISVGKITDFQRLEDVWTSPAAQALQQDIDNKTFNNCAVTRCGVLHHDMIDAEYTISINIDESCNLRCPSCRTQAVMISSGARYEEKLAWANHLVNLLQQFDQPCKIIMSGNGDPLASAIMRPLIQEFWPAANQTIRLFTNGLLLKKQLDDSPILNNITQYFISIDAGSAAVYERVRLGGQWSQLIANLTWLQDTAKRTGAEVLLKFVLQQDNYHDMQNFCKLCVDMGFDGVINRLEDWGTWANYAEHDVVGNISHTDHLTAMYCLTSAYSEYAGRIQFNPSLIELCHAQ